MHSARRLMLIDICMKFREDSLRGFQVTEQTGFMTDRQTEGQTDAWGKTICLPTLKGGDIMSTKAVLGSRPGPTQITLHPLTKDGTTENSQKLESNIE